MKKWILASLTLTLSLQAGAWSDLGHSTVGYIAEKHLTPQGQKFIFSIMGGDPLAIAAIWPDQVRNDKRYDGFANYHFLEIPEGMTYGSIPAERVAAKSADTIIDKAPPLIQSRKWRRSLSIPQKQILMKYFIHIVGDVHQPLHVGNGVDRGANLCDIKFPDAFDGKIQRRNLHGVWDDGIIEHMKKEVQKQASDAGNPIRYFSWVHLGDAILRDAEISGQLEHLKKQVESTSKADWYAESRALHSQVYPDQTPVSSPTERAYCKVVNAKGEVEDGKFDPAKVPEVSMEYIQKSSALIKRQLILAGLRLAKEINKMAKTRGDKQWSAEQEEKFFKEVMPELEPKKREPSSVKKKNVTEVHPHWCEHHEG